MNHIYWGKKWKSFTNMDEEVDALYAAVTSRFYPSMDSACRVLAYTIRKIKKEMKRKKNEH